MKVDKKSVNIVFYYIKLEKKMQTKPVATQSIVVVTWGSRTGKRVELQTDISKFWRVMIMFTILNVEMVSQAYIYTCKHQIVHF